MDQPAHAMQIRYSKHQVTLLDVLHVLRVQMQLIINAYAQADGNGILTDHNVSDLQLIVPRIHNITLSKIHAHATWAIDELQMESIVYL